MENGQDRAGLTLGSSYSAGQVSRLPLDELDRFARLTRLEIEGINARN